ncbi:MAG: glycosyltransferase family 39 protein [Betaproteobacteria bacterium]|nr:MAG: glycosyltransferase family 39 protein [Betaproteobacteria bacterium]
MSARPANNNVMAALTVLICAAWILPGLIGHDPWKPDEAYTFGLVYHLLQGGGWVVPTLAAEPFVEKPPLFILTAAAFAKLFSFLLPLHDGARLASGFYMALAFGFIAASGRELHGGHRGWVSALLVLGSLGLAVRAHQLIPDTALFAGFAMGTYGLALTVRRARGGGFWLGTGAGVGFMAKGLLAPGVLAATGVILVLTASEWRTRKAAAGAAIALLALLPWITVWPAALYLQSPLLFEQWLGTSFIARVVAAAAAGPRAEHFYYFAILPWYAWPVLPLALWVLWGTRYSRFGRPAIQLPVVLFLVCFGVLSVSAEGRELHAMPLLIPLGLLATPAVDNMRRGASNAMYWFGVMGFTFFAFVGWFYWSALELGVPQRLSLHLHKLQPAYESHVRWPAFVVALLYSGGWIALLIKLKRNPERAVVVWAAGTTLIWGLLMTLFIAYADVSKSYRSMIVSLTKSLPPYYDCISSRALAEPQRAMLHYQAGIITYREEVPERQRSCELLLVQGNRNDPPEIPPGWHQVWEGTRPGEKEEYFWLYGYGPPQPLQ